MWVLFFVLVWSEIKNLSSLTLAVKSSKEVGLSPAKILGILGQFCPRKCKIRQKVFEYRVNTK